MVETKLPKKREAQKTYPALCPNLLSAEYQSLCGAWETDSGPQDRPRREGAMGGTPGFQRRRWRAPPWGQRGRWVKAAETQLTKTPQPQVTQTLSEQTALSSLEVCIRGTSGEDSIARKSRVSIDNVHHATKKANKGVTTNKTKRKRTETDPEVSDVYQHIRGMPEESDANFTSSKRYLTKGKLSETQNRF